MGLWELASVGRKEDPYGRDDSDGVSVGRGRETLRIILCFCLSCRLSGGQTGLLEADSGKA